MVKKFIENISEGNFNTTEITLTGICLILVGVIIGVLIAPPRFVAAGSFNGNQGTLTKKGCKKK